MRLSVPLLIASSFRRFLCTPQSSGNPTTVIDAINQWTKVFKKGNVSEPESSIEHIMAHVLGYRRVII